MQPVAGCQADRTVLGLLYLLDQKPHIKPAISFGTPFYANLPAVAAAGVIMLHDLCTLATIPRLGVACKHPGVNMPLCAQPAAGFKENQMVCGKLCCLLTQLGVACKRSGVEPATAYTACCSLLGKLNSVWEVAFADPTGFCLQALWPAGCAAAELPEWHPAGIWL